MKSECLNSMQRKDTRVEEDVRTTRSQGEVFLSGDVGGTKTILGLFTSDSTSATPLVSETYESCRYSGLESIIGAFLAENPAPPRCASFAVAGPVRNGSAQVTNLPWRIDAAVIKDRFRIPKVFLLNDVEALAWAVPLFDRRKLETLNVGEPTPHGTSAVVAPGTGCGEAFLTWDGGRYTAHPSEGGHADFAPNDGLQAELWAFLREEFGHVSVERVASGGGIPNIYRFLRDRRGTEETAELAERLRGVEDPTPLIVSAAVEKRSALCEETLRTFVSILGAEAGNLALKILATGGIYLGGGIPRRILPFLQKGNLLRAFTGKGRFAPLLEKIPVHVVMDPHAVLHGAATRGWENRTD